MVTSNANAQEEITLEDLEQFGWEYVGETVKMYVYLEDVYACRQPSNKGRICTRMIQDNKRYFQARFAEGFRSKTVKPLLGNCVEMSGTIVEVDVQTQGAMSTFPALNIENIALADKSVCSWLE
jgi:hypothetical protein